MLRRALLALAFVEVKGLDDSHDVLPDGELTEDGGFLRKITDAGASTSPHGLFRDVMPVEEHAAMRRRNQADDHVEGRGLAGAVRAEQADDLASLQGQADILDGHLGVVMLG